MKWLLDTNVWIAVLKKRDAVLQDRFTANRSSDMCSCALVRAELMHGARKYAVPESRRASVDALLAGFTSLPFDDACADRYGVIRDDLESRSCVIGVIDMQIAAIALENDLTLVTGNGEEFRRVHGLKVEDWSKPQA